MSIRLNQHALVVSLMAALLLSVGCASTGASREQKSKQLAQKARSHMNLGVDYVRTGRVELGLREYLLAEALDPKNARIQWRIGDAYLLKGKHEKAEFHYRRSITLAPDFHDARLNLSGLLLETGQFEAARAESEYLADSATFPAPWRALVNRGWAEYKLGRVEEARGTLELARNFSPSYWPALLSLGTLEMEKGRRLEAIKLFQGVLDNRPAPRAAAEANYRIGEIYVALGKREAALGHLNSAVERAPESHWGTKSEEYLKLLN